jgi:hypothetical protein
MIDRAGAIHAGSKVPAYKFEAGRKYSERISE